MLFSSLPLPRFRSAFTHHTFSYFYFSNDRLSLLLLLGDFEEEGDDAEGDDGEEGDSPSASISLTFTYRGLDKLLDEDVLEFIFIFASGDCGASIIFDSATLPFSPR